LNLRWKLYLIFDQNLDQIIDQILNQILDQISFPLYGVSLFAQFPKTARAGLVLTVKSINCGKYSLNCFLFIFQIIKNLQGAL